jgi:predicted metal-dependent enzyme (double-stranded beta helix superfamily)
MPGSSCYVLGCRRPKFKIWCTRIETMVKTRSIPKAVSFAKSTQSVQLLVHGQGVLLFDHSDVSQSCFLRFFDSASVEILQAEFCEGAVKVRLANGEELLDPNNTKGIISGAGAYYWFSLDAQNRVLQAGIGEARADTVVYRYTFSDAAAKKWLETITEIRLDTASMPRRLLRDPIQCIGGVPLYVRDTNALTMSDVAKSVHIPVANLPVVAQKLHGCIAGRRFLLDDADFPEFSKAIEYSIATPGCWCYETLKAKSTTFGPEPNLAETYLRITLNQNNGESPGIPYVMEIWPSGHYSPIHNHGGSHAVIRVLHGRIHVRLFPYLGAGAEPFGTADFAKGQITWISPVLNQVHQLKNEGKQTCITIQCYMYDGEDSDHHDYFDYLDAAGKVQEFEPDSDMDFLAFKETIRREWNSRVRKCWLRRLLRI